ncbi:hypothetical protein BGC07_13650 [Piscirickettsia litoralis]|uniref:Class I SAM-dependent methyltransferase n=2 Tax=Piscirickettsia litoralis TaxID=1891921 RepID=A0ABX3A558_9GAMM|nr:hypothetical protein BGC07_13650 [Piscirickettsia litoralis]
MHISFLKEKNPCFFEKVMHNNYCYSHEDCDQALLKRSRFIRDYLKGFNKASNIPNKFYISNLIKSSMSIYGQMQEEKLMGFIRACMDSPSGDLVEIGSAWGRSSFALLNLSVYYDIGTLICIDSWNEKISVEQKSELTSSQLMQMNWDNMFDSFIVNMSNTISNNCNYIREISNKAIDKYEDSVIFTNEFGRSKVTNKIAILHIDANHNIEAVFNDIKIWSKYLVNNAWVIFDDYEWVYGDGPKNCCRSYREIIKPIYWG